MASFPYLSSSSYLYFSLPAFILLPLFSNSIVTYFSGQCFASSRTQNLSLLLLHFILYHVPFFLNFFVPSFLFCLCFFLLTQSIYIIWDDNLLVHMLYSWKLSLFFLMVHLIQLASSSFVIVLRIELFF